ncbi:MAG: hypothetical protein R3B89_19825 [Polyangiaceae bacterium]
MRRWLRTMLLVLGLLVTLLACKRSESTRVVSSAAPAVAKPGAPIQVSGDLDITIQADGSAKVSGTALEFTSLGTNLEVKKNGARIAKLTRESDRIKLRGADGETVTHKLKFKSDGKLELEDASGNRLYVAKPKDYGYKVNDAADAPIVSVKQKDTRVEAKKESGEEVFRVEGLTPKAASVLGFEKLDPELRAALAFFVSRSGL